MIAADAYAVVPDEVYASLDDYRRHTGPDAVALARSRPPAVVIEDMSIAGLRGRGGAGFPTARKWASVSEHPCPTRHVVCNAAEGEPGTFKDRWILRHNPYAVIEGMAIAAHAVGARAVTVAIKRRFRAEIAALRHAAGELASVLDDAALTFDVVEGPDVYLFGEEKALLEVIEGNAPMPREAHYPPYVRGLFATPGAANPAVVNNVQTFAHVPSILRHGPLGFREHGTGDTPGTLVVTVCGDVARPGVFEVEAGTSLREILYELAGGPRPGRAIKVVLSGVANAPILPDHLDVPADFGSLASIGSGLGSAGFIVYDDSRHALAIARAVARFLYVESCSQCSACKQGLGAASGGLDDLPIDDGRELGAALDRIVLSARSAPQGNRCYLPVQGSVLVPALVRAFRDEIAQVRPGDRIEPVSIHKLVDYDPYAHVFAVDERQADKRPDWSYAHGTAP